MDVWMEAPLGKVLEVEQGYAEDKSYVRLKLQLRNTLGKMCVVTVEAPPELADFYNPDSRPEEG